MERRWSSSISWRFIWSIILLIIWSIILLIILSIILCWSFEFSLQNELYMNMRLGPISSGLPEASTG